MKKKLMLLAGLVLLFIIFLGVRFFISNQQNNYGRIKVITSPASEVFIDNTAIGKTPINDWKMKVGEYLLKVIPIGDATATASWQGKIKVYKNALTYVNRELGSSDITSAGEIFTITKMDQKPKNSNYGEIYIETEPNGAIVYLDNDEKGTAPMVLTDVLKGDHEVSVYMPGFFRRTQKVNVNGEYRVNAAFQLAIDQTQQISEESTAPSTATQSATVTVAPTSATGKKTPIAIIKDTPTGFLRVREEPSIDASESARVKPGDQYEITDEQEGWYKIKYSGKEGWISSQYADKQSP